MKEGGKNKWKQLEGIVYSTDPGYTYNQEEAESEITLPPSQQLLYVAIDRKMRKGKTATLISGFTGRGEDRDDLARMLKSKCGTGGSVKDDYILIQGDFRDKIIQILNSEGYKTKKTGG